MTVRFHKGFDPGSVNSAESARMCRDARSSRSQTLERICRRIRGPDPVILDKRTFRGE